MTDLVATYVAASDNANEYGDDQRKGLEQAAREDIDNLISDTEERDEELWDELIGDSESTVADYDEVPVDERDLNWTLGLASLFAAGSVQFFLSNRQQLLINPLAYRSQKMDGFDLTRAQLVQAGKRDIITIPIEGYEQLQNKYLSRYSAIKAASNTELYSALVEQKALRPIEQHISAATGYVSRMTTYPPGSPQFKGAVADLVDTQSKTGLMTMNRRSVESLSMIQEAGGDPQALLVWLLDPSSKNCQYCLSRAGEVATAGQWEEDGLPGADVCAGGDRCNCHLAGI